MITVRNLCFATILAGSFAGFATAQTAVQPQAPNMPAPQNTIPEKIEPQSRDPSSTGSTGSGATLSDKLEATDGVIRPPSNIAPDMTVPAPNPDPGTTRIIPPPGSPGGNPDIQPK
jgi:hypothetical protein